MGGGVVGPLTNYSLEFGDGLVGFVLGEKSNTALHVADVITGVQPPGCASKDHNTCQREDGHAPGEIGAIGRPFGDQRPQNQAGDQPSNVSAIVDTRRCGSADQAICRENEQASHRPARDLSPHREFAQVERCD